MFYKYKQSHQVNFQYFKISTIFIFLFFKILHEASTKDNRIMCLDGQLSKLQKSLNAENAKVSKLTIELERSVAISNKSNELLEQKEQGIYSM